MFSDQGEVDFTASDLRFTTKGNVLYVIIMGKPERELIRVASLRQGEGLGTKEIASIDIIGGAQNLDWRQDPQQLEIVLKGRLPSEHANVLKITYRS